MWLPVRWFTRLTAGDMGHSRLAARLAASGVVAVGLAVPSGILSLRSELHAFCFLQFFLQIPCPGCGMTRALVALAHGDIPAAVALNPASIVLAGSLLLPVPIAMLGNASPSAKARTDRLFRIADGALLAALMLWWMVVLVSLFS